jgi:UDP-N-acetylmuramoylalanine--D-glutamate ligase
LDWHRSQAEYWDHKGNLTRHQQPGDLCVFHADSLGGRHIGKLGLGEKLGYGLEGDDPLVESLVDSLAESLVNKACRVFGFGDIHAEKTGVEWPTFSLRLNSDQVGLPGPFNLENLAAAGTLALAMGLPHRAVTEAAQSFGGLPHRFECLGDIGGRAYINDSYATRPEASLGAIAATAPNPTGLILGGSEKFADFTELAEAVAASEHIQAIALIGATAARLKEDLSKAWQAQRREGAPWEICDNLEKAVLWLESQLPQGTVLLSPACASFGLFTDYKQRGEAFRALFFERKTRKK